MYTALNLTEQGRATLLSHVGSSHKNVLAHHITVEFNVPKDSQAPEPATVKVIGYAINGNIEAVVVAVDGREFRKDGKRFHITISHADGIKPVASNDLIANDDFLRLIAPFEVETTPAINA